VIVLVLNVGKLREGGLPDVIKEGSSPKWKFNFRVVIKYFIVGVLVSIRIFVLCVNHGAFNEILRIKKKKKLSHLNKIFSLSFVRRVKRDFKGKTRLCVNYFKVTATREEEDEGIVNKYLK
jgi:hypothetical protein